MLQLMHAPRQAGQPLSDQAHVGFLLHASGGLAGKTPLPQGPSGAERIGQKVNVPDGISSIPGYMKVDDPVLLDFDT
jgi:hypothetical protein